MLSWKYGLNEVEMQNSSKQKQQKIDFISFFIGHQHFYIVYCCVFVVNYYRAQ